VAGGTFVPGTGGDCTIEGAAPGDLPTVKLTDGATCHLTGGQMRVGDTGNRAGALEIRSGSSLATTSGEIGSAAGSQGEVTVDGRVDGTPSTWDISVDLCVGRFGTGTLEVTNGGSLGNRKGYIGLEPGPQSTVTVDGSAVDGTPSTWNNSAELYVGYRGTGTLDIADGGSVANTYGHIGHLPGSQGTVRVDGAGSTWNNSGDLVVAMLGTGRLDISDGGTVTNTEGFMAYDLDSQGMVKVDGAGSTWNNSEELYVGFRGTGTLDIADGGSVSSSYAAIAYEFFSHGSVTVDGAGSTWTNSGDLLVGGSPTAAGGPGVLTVQTGGTVDAGAMLKLSTTGTVNLNGGTVRAAEFDVEAGTFNFNAGTLNYAEDLTTMPADLLSQLLGPARTVSFAKHVRVDGTTTLQSILTLDGGIFSTGSLVNPGFLDFKRGTFNLHFLKTASG